MIGLARGKKKFKALCALFVIVCVIACGCSKNSVASFADEKQVHVVSTIFVGCDIARTVGGDLAEIKLLLKPGSESHSFEPTPKDIITIEDSDVFICSGGENDAWVDTILDGISNKDIRIIRMTECVPELYEEEIVEGMEEEEEHDHEDDGEETEWDEHVWMDADNAVAIADAIRDAFSAVKSENADTFTANAAAFADELLAIDAEIRGVVDSATCREVIFADRFPARYFTERYGLTYYAAFPGCSENTEASAATVSFLIDKTKEDGIPAVFAIELSSGKLADAVAEETGAEVLTFYTGHNVTAADFEAGVSFTDMMRMNCEALKEALN